MTELPNGWVLTNVAEIAATSLGKMLDAKQATGKNPTPYLRNINVRWGRFDLSDVASMDIRPEELDRVLAQPGDVVACEGGEPGRAAVWRGPGAVALQKALHRVRPSGAVAADYVALLLRHQAVSGALADRFTGTTIKHLPQEKLRMVEVPLAPRAEQDRIVAAIDEAFSKLDAGEVGLRIVRQRLQCMRDAVLAAAVSGRLVPQDPSETSALKLLTDLEVDVHPDSELPESWAQVEVGAIAKVGTGTTPSRANSAYWLNGTVPWVTSALLNYGTINSTAEFVTPAALTGTSLRVWPRGTLLLAMYGEGKTRGKCAELAIDATCNQACAAIDLRAEVQWMRPFLRLSFVSAYLANRRLASGGVQPNLNLGLVKRIRVPVPPADEQRRIVAEVERHISFIEACERAADLGLARSGALRRSVLKAAFEGKLVPQDPSDEPASMLLERIRAELRESAPVRSRPPRKVAR